MAAPALRLSGVSKHYGATRALEGIDLEVAPGTVHALVGENGAGKSTTLGIAGGRVVPSAGSVECFGEPLPVGSPRQIQAQGVVAIYQELTIVEAMSAEANVFLGHPASNKGLLARGEMKRRYVELAERFGVTAWPGKRAGELSVAEQQLLEIMRALAHDDVRMILFDEPSASLALSEKEALHDLIADLRERGYTMIIVSHDLDEVLKLSDAVSVFREGRLVDTRPQPDWDVPQLVEAMLGRSAGVHRERIGKAKAFDAGAEPCLEVSELAVEGVLADVDFSVRSGEIVGIAGLVGAGRSTILRSLAGAEPGARGRIWIDGEEGGWPRSVRAAQRLGIGLLPEDRKRQGIIGARSGAENALLTNLSSASSFGWVSRRKLRQQAAEAAAACGFDPRRLGDQVRNLSGGNQQKLLLSRWRHSRPRVLLCDEPTRGIDIGAKEEMMATIEAMAAEGVGVVVVSSELEELLAVCHRIVVLSGGGLVADLDSEKATLNGLLELAFSRVGASHAKAGAGPEG